MLSGEKYVVVGGGGFVGKALCLKLKSLACHVVALGRNSYPDLEEAGVECFQVDVGTPPDHWKQFFRGAHGVFHSAAKVEMWGRRKDFVRVNVQGTRNVIQACLDAAVPSLVFTSSPSVIADGSNLCGIDESCPYPDRYQAFYPETKARAEREVLAANQQGVLKTVSLRPHLIWGPGDTNLIPTILAKAKAKKLVRVGDGTNLVDLTYIDDCVEAHLLAMQALSSNPQQVAGKAYFISQGDPVRLWDWINQVLVQNGLPKVTRTVTPRTALLAARVLEAGARILEAFNFSVEPALTTFLVKEMSTSHYFSIEAAKRDLGFKPSLTVEQAMLRLYPRIEK